VNFWKGKKVLITGITGFVGHKLADRLTSEDAFVVGLTKDYGRNWVQFSHMEVGDVTDYQKLCNIISEHEIDTVFHLAANAIVRVAARDPMSTYRTNVMGTVAVLEACRNVGRCKRIVVASSDKAYGDHEQLPYTEGFALQPKNTYDTSKACMDMIAQSYAANYGMNVAVTRCSNIYGPGDKNMSRIIPNTINRILDGKRPMLYSDIEKMEREFIFIDDVVDAYSEIAEWVGLPDWTGNLSFVFNIGGTGALSIRSLVEKICSQMDAPGDVEIVPRENVFKEIQRQYIDATKLTSYTGWTPKVSLDDGLKKTIDWYGKQR
jgi:CDP-glucose 4,6-dehydratase